MDLSFFTALSPFALLFISAMAYLRERAMARYFLLDGKNITYSVISTSTQKRRTTCAIECASTDNCESFFYNTMTSECQLHEYVFLTTDGATYQTGLQYYYMVGGRNHWCPFEKGFQLLSEDGPCVKFHNDTKTWYDANDTCVSYSPNSRLAVLDTEKKQDMVKEAGIALGDIFRVVVWIGLSEYIDNVYRWVDGQNMTFFTWARQDNSKPNIHDCVALFRSNDWKWNRLRCSKPKHYLCEMVNII